MVMVIKISPYCETEYHALSIYSIQYGTFFANGGVIFFLKRVLCPQNGYLLAPLIR